MAVSTEILGLDDANLLITHLQARAENDRFEMARELHDNLGGLLVAAMMDVAHAQRHPAMPAEIRGRLARAAETLRGGIDLKRQLVERLRPSLLNDIGVVPALSHLLRSRCEKLGVDSADYMGVRDLSFPEGVSIVLYRMVQEALDIALAHPGVSSVRLHSSLDSPVWSLVLETDEAHAPEAIESDRRSASFLSLSHRARGIGAQVMLTAPRATAACFTFRVERTGQG